MADLRVDNLRIRLGGNDILKGVSLQLKRGEVTALLGPSGSGKTTLLRAVAGLEQPYAGRIEVAGAPVFDGEAGLNLPTEARGLGFVFQSYALWPHRTVEQNVCYSLVLRGVGEAEQKKAAQRVLDNLGLGHLGHRYPHELSGGQQQRVAIARSLVYEPSVVLLDEPLSNLDAKLREEVRVEIRELQRKLGLTAILVTHDQEEALTVGDRLVVMNGGHVCQIGDKRALYERPADRFVASFIGRSSFVDGHVKDQGVFETLDGLRLKITTPAAQGPASLALRPERCRLGTAAHDCDNVVSGQVEFVSYLGSALDVHVRIGAQSKLIVQIANQGSAHEPQLGETVQIGWASTAGLLYPSDQGRHQ